MHGALLVAFLFGVVGLDPIASARRAKAARARIPAASGCRVRATDTPGPAALRWEGSNLQQAMSSIFSRSTPKHARCRLCQLVTEYPADAASPLGWLDADLCGECATVYSDGSHLFAVRPECGGWIVATARRRDSLAVMDARFAPRASAGLAQEQLDAAAERLGLSLSE